jgi:L-ascorbate metabolism protein UlaG (beta-lactamase superfamily)
MKLTWLGHAAFLLENGDAQVLIDPFLSGNPAASAQADQFSPQTILLTHAHNDHVGDTVAIAKRAGSKVIATFELGTWIGTQGVEDAVGANHGGTVAFKGGTVKFVPAWHTSSYEHNGQFVAPGLPAGLVVKMGDKTIYFAGDTALFLDMQLIGEEGLDVAVLPIGDHFTMGPDDALRAVKLLHPKVVIPCHYDTFAAIEQDEEAFKQQVERQTDATCTVLKPGESIEI